MSSNPFLPPQVEIEQKRYLKLMILGTVGIAVVGFLVVTFLFIILSIEISSLNPEIGGSDVSYPVSFPDSFPVSFFY